MMKKGMFSFDAPSPIFHGWYSEGDYWNGWVKPWLDQKSVDLLVADTMESESRIVRNGESVCYLSEDGELFPASSMKIDGERFWHIDLGYTFDMHEEYKGE